MREADKELKHKGLEFLNEQEGINHQIHSQERLLKEKQLEWLKRIELYKDIRRAVDTFCSRSEENERWANGLVKSRKLQNSMHSLLVDTGIVDTQDGCFPPFPRDGQ